MKHTVYHFNLTSAIFGTCTVYYTVDTGVQIHSTDFECSAEIPGTIKGKICEMCETLPRVGRELWARKLEDGIAVYVCRKREKLTKLMKMRCLNYGN